MTEFGKLAGDGDGDAAGRPEASRVYVLRLWREPAVGAGPCQTWRASLLNPLTQRRRYFSSPATLTSYLAALDPAWPTDDDCLEFYR